MTQSKYLTYTFSWVTCTQRWAGWTILPKWRKLSLMQSHNIRLIVSLADCQGQYSAFFLYQQVFSGCLKNSMCPVYDTIWLVKLHKNVKHVWLQLFKYKDLPLFSIISDGKWLILEVWTVSWTKEPIWIFQFENFWAFHDPFMAKHNKYIIGRFINKSKKICFL